MTVTYSKPVRIDDTAVRLSFTSDVTPPVPFRVWHNGVQEGSFTSADGTGFVDLHIPVGEAHAVEVFDKACSVPKPAFPGRITVHWSTIAGASSYRVEQYIAAVWTLKATYSDDGKQAWVWLSDWLDDVTTYQFRVVPVDSAGNQGTALSFTVEMVRTPDFPSVTYTWSAGTGKITIAAA